MQKIYFSFILVASLLTATLLFTSCSKDDPKPSDSLSAKVGGTAFTSTSLAGVKSGGLITIIGANSTNSLTLMLADTLAIGKYNSIEAMYTDGSKLYSSTSGNLEITKHDATAMRIEGKFNFKAEDSTVIDVTEGSFALTYKKQ